MDLDMNSQSIKETKPYKCPLCEYRFSDRSELENHLLVHHFLSMQSFCEMVREESDPGKCYKCGDGRPPLTYTDNKDTFYLPCWDCVTNKFEKSQSIITVQEAIRDYFSNIVKDRYLQMFLLGVYFDSTLDHTYTQFKEVLKLLQKREKYDRNSIWFLDWIPGYPKVLCPQNINGIKVVKLDSMFECTSQKDMININDLVIRYPEYIPFDQRHHSRYNIFNVSSDSRNTKRLRLKTKDKCLKFWNGLGDDTWKAIFRIENKNGDTVPASSLSSGYLTVIKMVLMRNKNFARLIGELVDEFVKNTGFLSDSAFLRNTVRVNPTKDIAINLSWLPEYKRENYINISILL